MATPAGEIGSLTVSIEPSLENITASCLMNAHYHSGREAFLDNVHRAFMFGVIAFGAAALVDILPDGDKVWVKSTFSAIAAILGALDLTFDLSNRARAHAMMKRRYFDLLAEVREKTKSTSYAKACLDRYSGDESPPYFSLLFSCWNHAQKKCLWIWRRSNKNQCLGEDYKEYLSMDLA